MTRFARNLAHALWRRAAEAGNEAVVEARLKRAYRVFRANPRLRQVMMHPSMDSARRADLLAHVCDPDEITAGLLLTLAEHRAFSCFGEVLRGFGNFRALHSKELAVDAWAAAPLSPGEADRVAGVLEEALGRKIRLKLRTRKDLLGGLRIKIGEMTIDGSLRGAFDRMEKRLAS